MEPASPLARFVAAALGAAPGSLEWRWLGPREGPTELWLAVGCARVVVKRHLRGRGYAQERAAYRALAAPLAPWLPRLLAADDALGAIILSFETGDVLPDDTPPALAVAAHAAAGAALRALHEAPVAAFPADPLPLAEALRRRADAASRRGAGLLPATLLDRLAAAFARTRAFDGVARAPAHRDFGPWNWLVDPAVPGLWVVDWEHARPDAPVVDRVRLRLGAWAARPDLEAAFDRGYGRPCTDREEAQFALLAALHVVVTLTWAEGRPAALAPAAARHLEHLLRAAPG